MNEENEQDGSTADENSNPEKKLPNELTQNVAVQPASDEHVASESQKILPFQHSHLSCLEIIQEKPQQSSQPFEDGASIRVSGEDSTHVKTVMAATSEPDSNYSAFPITTFDDNGNLNLLGSKEINSNETLKWFPYKESSDDKGSVSTLLIVHINEIKPTLDSTLEEFHSRIKFQLEKEEIEANAAGEAITQDETERQFHMSWKMSQFYAHNKKELVDTSIPVEGTNAATMKVTLRQRIHRMLKTSCYCTTRRV